MFVIFSGENVSKHLAKAMRVMSLGDNLNLCVWRETFSWFV